MLRIRTVGERRTERNELSIRSNELLDPDMLTLARHEDVIHSGDFTTLVTANLLVEVETKAILHVPARIEDRNRTIAALEIITFQLFYVLCNLTARVSLAQNPAGVVQQKEDPKGHWDYGRPKQHSRASSTHHKEDKTEHPDADSARIG